ncbi:MAG: HAD-IA family hydrolase [Verrucomicrobiota bacterium]
MAQLKNIILDWSGTLVDDLHPVVEATNSILREYGKAEMSLAEFRASFRLPFTEWYAEVLPEVSMERIEHYYQTAFTDLENQVEMLPGARDFLEFCHGRGVPLFLLSSISQRHYDIQGERLDIARFFTQAYAQTMDKRHVIKELLADHDLNADETLFVGDMVHDIEAGHHGGVVTCAVLTGYDDVHKLKTANPELLFPDIGGLQRFLEKHDFQLGGGAAVVPTVGALITGPDDKWLLVRTHKWSDKWGIPGGKIKYNEPSEDALRREIAEETGLEIDNVRFEIVQDCREPEEFYRRAHFLLLNYSARASSSQVRLNEEAEEYRWCTPEEALALDLNRPTRILLDYVRHH